MLTNRLFFLALLGVGCSAATPSGPTAQRGDLGNGTFTFRCDDSVACERWSNSAAVFPEKVAAGSTFNLNFFLEDQKLTLVFGAEAEPSGYRVEPVGDFASKAASGIAAVKPGRATFMVRDGLGRVVDYTSLEIVKPEGLIVYDSELREASAPPQIKTVALNLTNATRKSLSVVAKHRLEAVAGAIAVEWTSSDKSIVDIESYTRGKVTVLAKRAGTATLKAASAGDATSEELTVEVKP